MNTPRDRAASKKHHIIYRTTCLVTGRYYIGMHSTNNLADGYMGSGKCLWRNFRKHDLHVSEIIEHLESREALRARETELVTEELIRDPMCMNIALGGEGGWEHVHQAWQKAWQDPLQRESLRLTKSQNAKAGWQDQDVINSRLESISKSSTRTWQSSESRLKLSTSLKKYVGDKASQHNTCWVIKDDQPKKIKLELLNEHLQNGYKRGRK